LTLERVRLSDQQRRALQSISRRMCDRVHSPPACA
jgi:hypothetical protein